MPTVICLLRGVNLGGHHLIKMDALRTLCSSLKLRCPTTYIQSGNIIFGSDETDLPSLAKRIGDAIERKAGFRPEVMLRTVEDLRSVIAANPFAARPDVEPSKLAVTFLSADPGDEVREKVRRIPSEPEELRIEGRELFIHYPNGMGRPRLSMALVEKTLKVPGTSRNWNTVKKLLEMAERHEAGER